jgi:hypothetical protein
MLQNLGFFLVEGSRLFILVYVIVMPLNLLSSRVFGYSGTAIVLKRVRSF